jgi:drug/metabolite transporter (DMT)-like permease
MYFFFTTLLKPFLGERERKKKYAGGSFFLLVGSFVVSLSFVCVAYQERLEICNGN